MIDLPKLKIQKDQSLNLQTQTILPTEEPADILFAKQNALANKTSILKGSKGGEADEDDPYGETFYSSIRRWLKKSKPSNQKVP